jgi:hypothetical protein
MDEIRWYDKRRVIGVESCASRVVFIVSNLTSGRTKSEFKCWSNSSSSEGWTDYRLTLERSIGIVPGFGAGGRVPNYLLMFPHWFLVLLSAAFATAPWIRWRFSLRTLLIATTLVAVVLGLIVWAART